MQKDPQHRVSKNWFFWSGLFLSGTALSAWQEWQSDIAHTMGWFIAISIWSALCAIGYSLVDWLTKK